MTYRAPVADITFALKTIAGMDASLRDGRYDDVGEELLDAILEEASRFATDEIAPLNASGDRQKAQFDDGAVTMPDGFRDMYRAWAEGGWSGVSAPEAYGGQDLPLTVSMAVSELWNQACMSFGTGMLLTMGQIEALAAHASDDLKSIYLPRLASGEWTGTMNLTEPQAGSDLALLKSRAEPVGDGSYRIFGTKIFITYGEHDMADNIVHLVLARLPDAPPGTRGISLFVVPKFLVNDDGSLGEHNDVTCIGIEKKLGLHASPTCTMVYGDKGEGAIGWLVGEENRGLHCMFTMMNNARLAVGVQGVAIAERALQQAEGYAAERRQGRHSGMGPDQAVTIGEHPDVRRNLYVMRAMTEAARAICYRTALELDLADRDTTPEGRKRALETGSLLTPIAKAFSTDVGVDVASIGVQIHGGMGYVEETGAAQHLRDARIAPIYEGTNGIQAIDLVTRKIGQSDGAVADALIAEFREIAEDIAKSNAPSFGHMAARLAVAISALEEATAHMRDLVASNPTEALAGATPYLKLFSLVAGGSWLAKGALHVQRDGARDAVAVRRVRTARFFAEHVLIEARALSEIVIEGSGSVIDDEDLFPAAVA